MQIIEDKKIYIDFPRCKSIKEYIKKLINENFLYKNRSFTDKNLKTIQCGYNRERSISDLYYIVKTEYPSTNLKKFLKIYGELLYVTKKGSNYVLGIFYCDDIHKFIFGNSTNNHYIKYNDKLFRMTSGWRYHNDDNKCVDGFTVELLTKLMNYEKLHPISS